MKPHPLNTLLVASLLTAGLSAQMPTQGIPVDSAIAHALHLSSLAEHGEPFHAVMQIGGPTPAYSGTIELTWADPDTYRLVLSLPGFSQVRVVEDTYVSEENHGDYLPVWLETLSQALLDPRPLLTIFRGQRGEVAMGPNLTGACVSRDDRPGGITNQLTWGVLCFSGQEPRLASILTFNRDVTFSEYKGFGSQQIARTYTTDVLDFKEVKGRLTTLEAIKPDPAMFRVDHPTPAAQRIESTLVSTLREESMVEVAPKLTWPTVHEGRTEGYMIVYARTDRTGQVRETAKHNSDNPGLEQFGMEQALRFKFKPLVIDGVPQQMEMPLVLHFTSSVADPLPTLDDAHTRAQISGCTIPQAKPGQRPFRISVSVNEEGKLTGEGYPDANTPDAPHHSRVDGFSLFSCRFAPLLVGGKATYYHGILLLP